MFLVGLDIGSKYVKGCLFEYLDGQLKILQLEKVEYKGSQKGVTIDIAKTVDAINSLKNNLFSGFNETIESYIVTISGKDISNFRVSHKLPLWKKEGEQRRVKITQKHVDGVISLASDSYQLKNTMILHTIPQYYTIDGEHKVKNPVDMTGTNLEGEICIINAPSLQVDNLETVLKKCNINSYYLVYAPIATSEAVIDEGNKERGVVFINLGAQTTELAIYNDGILSDTEVISLGSDNITKDLKYVLKTYYDNAERIKREYGNVDLDKIDKNLKVRMEESMLDEESNLKNLELISKIIIARLEEIYEIVLKKIYDKGHQDIKHIILTGPALALKGAENYFRKMTNPNSSPEDVHLKGIELNGFRDNSDYYTAIGAVKHFVNNYSFAAKEEAKPSFWSKVKNFMGDIV